MRIFVPRAIRLKDFGERAVHKRSWYAGAWLRAMLDQKVVKLNEQIRRTINRTILELTKVARQRAATGARLRVIRQITGMPSAFEKAEIEKPFVFTCVVQNTDFILKTPEGRAMATAQALGWDEASLFGAKKIRCLRLLIIPKNRIPLRKPPSRETKTVRLICR